MIWFFILFSALAIGLYVAAIAISEADGFSCGFFSMCFSFFAFIVGWHIWGTPAPDAIDVYRNKTTLEITYRDSVAVDSVVVWKEE